MNQKLIKHFRRFACFSAALFFTAGLSAQQIQFCGIHSQPGSGQPGQEIHDRFGNTYAVDEILRVQAKGSTSSCSSSGIFRLNFIGNFAADDEATICQVFQDLSDLVAGNSTAEVPVNIMQEPMSFPSVAAGTDLFTGHCGLIHSSVLQRLRTGEDNLPSGVATSVMHIRVKPTPSTTWFSLEDELLDPISNTEFDLYTVVLHEALHILGFASLMGLDGGSISLLGVYRNWDRFLTAGNMGDKLIIPDANGSCCGAHKFNETDFPDMPLPLTGGCGINVQFTEGTNNYIAPVNDVDLTPNDDDEMANKLSHLDISCGSEDYVMHPDLAPGVLRRTVTAAEITILCNLGYRTDGCDQDCVALAQDDYVLQPIILSGQGVNNPLFVPFSSLLANDIEPEGATVSLVTNCGTGSGINVQAVTGGFEITGLSQGAWSFCYRLSGCDETVCDNARGTVIVLNSRINPVVIPWIVIWLVSETLRSFFQ